jgi:glycine/D-amino acid oxidase-like deaminating enzyme
MHPPDPSGVLWLDQALAAEPSEASAPLDGDWTVDVCIVGGGYTGLWTALELQRTAPGVRTLVIDAAECGFGASGRNGGWALGWYDKLHYLVEEFGETAGLWLAERARRAVVALDERCRDLGIDCHYRRSGSIDAESAPGQAVECRAPLELCEAHGLTDRYRRLEPDEARRRTGIALLGDGAEQVDTATVHPGLLVRGLRRAARERGVQIAERTRMVSVGHGRPVRIETDRGTVTAEQAVLAIGAWGARLRELRRAILPFASHIVATEPAPERIEASGWSDGVAVSDLADLVYYAQVTRDGRVAFGRGGGAIGRAGHVRDTHCRDPRWTRVVAEGFRRWFPALGDVRLTHFWGGPVDLTPGHFPFVQTLGPHGNVHYGGGYSGDGVAQSTVIASILAAKATGADTEDARSPLADGARAFLPPEPLRTLGGVAVREAVLRAEAREARGQAAGPIAGRLRRLSSFRMPGAVDPRVRRAAP